MNLDIVFIKDHFSGLKEGTRRTLGFEHAVRLIEEGWAEPENKEEFDANVETYKAQQQEIRDKVAARLAELEQLLTDDEERKAKMREEGAVAKKVRMSTADIQSEEPFPKQNKNSKGGKNK